MEVLGSKARGPHQGVGGCMGNGWSQRAKGFTSPPGTLLPTAAPSAAESPAALLVCS